jgi:hypothetical protein
MNCRSSQLRVPAGEVQSSAACIAHWSREWRRGRRPSVCHQDETFDKVTKIFSNNARIANKDDEQICSLPGLSLLKMSSVLAIKKDDRCERLMVGSCEEACCCGMERDCEVCMNMAGAETAKT